MSQFREELWLPFSFHILLQRITMDKEPKGECSGRCILRNIPSLARRQLANRLEPRMHQNWRRRNFQTLSSLFRRSHRWCRLSLFLWFSSWSFRFHFPLSKCELLALMLVEGFLAVYLVLKTNLILYFVPGALASYDTWYRTSTYGYRTWVRVDMLREIMIIR